MRAIFDVRMGSIDDAKDAELIRNASPLFKADKIVRPLLIGQGANDPRVNFWAVIRDDRGGVGWTRGTATPWPQ